MSKTKPISNNWFSNACTKAIISCLVNNYITANSKQNQKFAKIIIKIKKNLLKLWKLEKSISQKKIWRDN